MTKLLSTLTATDCDCDDQGEGELTHPMSLLLIGCNKVLGLLVMVYLAYRSFSSRHIFFILCQSHSYQSSPRCCLHLPDDFDQVQPLPAHLARQRAVVLRDYGELSTDAPLVLPVNSSLLRRWSGRYHSGRSKASTTLTSNRWDLVESRETLNWIEFSFFQLVEAPSLSEGLRQLEFDNKTESANTINILHRWDSLQSSFTHFKFSPNSPSIQTLIRNCCCRSPKLLYTGSTSTKRLCLPDCTTSTPSGCHPFSSTPTPSSPFRFFFTSVINVSIVFIKTDIVQHQSLISFSSRGSFWVPCTL